MDLSPKNKKQKPVHLIYIIKFLCKLSDLGSLDTKNKLDLASHKFWEVKGQLITSKNITLLEKCLVFIINIPEESCSFHTYYPVRCDKYTG